MHLDVKPSNILVNTPLPSPLLHPFPVLKVTSGGVCKLGDFGCSVGLASNGKGPAVELTGTPGYQVADSGWIAWSTRYRQAPELLKGEAPSRACDVYSLGILLWQLDSRSIPYAGQHPQVKIIHNKLPIVLNELF